MELEYSNLKDRSFSSSSTTSLASPIRNKQSNCSPLQVEQRLSGYHHPSQNLRTPKLSPPDFSHSPKNTGLSPGTPDLEVFICAFNHLPLMCSGYQEWGGKSTVQRFIPSLEPEYPQQNPPVPQSTQTRAIIPLNNVGSFNTAVIRAFQNTQAPASPSSWKLQTHQDAQTRHTTEHPQQSHKYCHSDQNPKDRSTQHTGGNSIKAPRVCKV